jgi:hypothetical protein
VQQIDKRNQQGDPTQPEPTPRIAHEPLLTL